MHGKASSGLIFALLLGILTLAATSILVTKVSAWNNGGYSSDPTNPDYGTHDWIAEHALDWLPAHEKQYILDNRATYFYGTELPDNNQAPDGIGDTAKHHIYYNSSETVTDDAAAIRASTEYDNAHNSIMAKDFIQAAKNAGTMTHYIADMAVFGHVMGSGTEWGAEVHHSDYETYVNTRTSSYSGSEFSSYLDFDGTLATVSAYDAARKLAYDTTFDINGNLTCVWMDQNYNWNNPAFKNRAGESLNLAINYLTDVLHTLYQASISIPDEFYITTVPYHHQINNYYCGPASLEMVFDFYGLDIPQSEIADVARTAPDGTYTSDMIRASHFSNLSTSVGREMPENNITGYTARKLGYAAFEYGGMTIDQLKSLIAAGYPIIVLTQWHFRVAVGYDSTHITFQDSYYGKMHNMTSASFDIDWDYSGHWALLVTPWKIELNVPQHVLLGSVFNATATITYPLPPPFNNEQYAASLSNATLTLPLGLSLVPGETAKKTMDTGDLAAGTTANVKWKVLANALGNYNIEVQTEGKVHGSVPPLPSYPQPYSYADRIGGVYQTTVDVILDETPPVTVDDYDDLWHTTDFTITLTAADNKTGVAETYYKINDGPIKTINADELPLITTETAQNKLEYWSTDKAGNEENHHILTGIKLDKTAPTGSIMINNDNAYTTTTIVTLTLSTTDTTSGVAEVRFSNDNVTYTEWNTYATSTPWTVKDGDAIKAVYTQFKDHAGLISMIYLDTIMLDTVPPTGSVMISENATYTNSPSVILTLSAQDATAGVAEMRFSHDSGAWTKWEAYSPSKTWVLTAFDGTKNVYVQFRDNTGLISQTSSDAITLDATPPTITINNPALNSETRTTTLNVTWTGADETSGINQYEIRLDNGTWINVETNTAHTFTALADGTHIVNIKATDNVGNTRQEAVSFTVNTSAFLGPRYLELAVITATIIIVAIGTGTYILKTRKKRKATIKPIRFTSPRKKVLDSFQTALDNMEEEGDCSFLFIRLL